MKKRIVIDIILNMLANFLPIFALQFVILPQVSLRISSTSYGQLLTVLAFIYLTSTSFGSVLNNSKLVQYKKYEENNLSGDFSIFLIMFSIANILITIAGLMYYGHSLNIFSNILLVIVSSILLFNTYAIVEFRIKLNFINILLNSVYLLAGYVIGFCLFLFTKEWIMIYFCGFGLNFIYILKNTSIIKEKIIKTNIYIKTLKEISLLLISGLLVSLGSYADKLIIFPLLGGSAVSIYYTASILGKTVSLAIGPMTGVLLSYLAHYKEFTTRKFNFILLLSVIIGVIGYFSLVFVSEPLLTFVYPQYVMATLQYIPVVTLSTIIALISSVINPILLKFYSAKWQLAVNGIHMFLYITLALVFLSSNGLMGLCTGILISNIIKLLFMIFTFYFLNSSIFNKKARDIKWTQ